MNDQVFDKFRARLLKEGWLKAVLCGLTVGFAALLITAAICWFTGFKAVWICAIVFVAATAISIPVFFFALFKPTEKSLARRMDGLGLEERIITMNQLAGDNSFMATRQREDAIAAISKVDAKLIKIAVSVPLIIAFGTAAVLGSGMTVVSSLAAADVIKSGNKLVADLNEEPVKTYTITYEVAGDGYIEGDIVQLIDEGEDASEVLAVSESGYAFVGWTGTFVGADGNVYEIDDLKDYKNPSRQDVEIDRDMTLTAVFMEVDKDGDGDGDGDETDGDPSDSNSPLKEGNGNGDPSEIDSNIDLGDPNQDNGAGGQYSDAGNQVIDGETYYGGDTYNNAYNDAMDSSGSDGDRGIIGDYFDMIKD